MIRKFLVFTVLFCGFFVQSSWSEKGNVRVSFFDDVFVTGTAQQILHIGNKEFLLPGGKFGKFIDVNQSFALDASLNVDKSTAKYIVYLSNGIFSFEEGNLKLVKGLPNGMSISRKFKFPNDKNFTYELKKSDVVTGFLTTNEGEIKLNIVQD